MAKPAAKAETDENTLPEEELLEDEADTPVDEDDLPEDEDFIAAKVDEDEDDNAAAPITNDEDFIDEIDDDNVLDGEDGKPQTSQRLRRLRTDRCGTASAQAGIFACTSPAGR